MNIWHDIESSRITPEEFIAVIEISKASKQKYELDNYKNEIDKLKSINQELLMGVNKYQSELIKYEDRIYNLKIEQNNMNEIIKNKELIQDSLKIEINNLSRELKDIESIIGNSSQDEEGILLNKYYKIEEEINNLNKDKDILKIEEDKLNIDIVEIENINRNISSSVSKLERELKDI